MNASRQHESGHLMLGPGHPDQPAGLSGGGIVPLPGTDRTQRLMHSGAAQTGGTLLNQKLSPQLLADDEGLTHFTHLVRAYFAQDAHHIQFNVVTRATLLAALADPAKHRDLIVRRVAGYSDYFANLTPELQQEIIRNTEQEAF